MIPGNRMDEVSSVMAARMARMQQRLLEGTDVMTRSLEDETGTTPKDEVLAMDRWKMYRYRPVVENPHPIPVIVFYALVNRYYMIDLQPNRSMVKKFLEAGLDVYAVDWGHPTRGDQFLTTEDYINEYMDTAIDTVREMSGSDKVTLYGICQGGTFSSIYTATHPEKVANLALMVTPINFHTNDGLLNVWSSHLNPDLMVDTFGNVPGDFMNMGFLLLNPLRLVFQKYIDFIEHMDDPEFVGNFLRMEKWIFDSPDQAGENYRNFIRSMYIENQLIEGEFMLGDQAVDLADITQPVLNVYGEKDHLVPPECSMPFEDLVSSTDKTTMAFPTGHIGLFTSSRSQKEYAPAIAQWLVEHCGENGQENGRATKPKTSGRRAKAAPAKAAPAKAAPAKAKTRKTATRKTAATTAATKSPTRGRRKAK